MPRYTVRTDIPPALRTRGFVAWVHDAQHPDDPDDGCSCCWSEDKRDAERIARALNRDADARRAATAERRAAP